jgi:ParB-like chromosome segregation protein Spo0J
MAKIKLSELKVNPGNPRLIKDHKFKSLVKSLKEFPEMMKLRPIVVTDENIILGGNMRYRGLLELGYKEIPSEWKTALT